MTLGATRDRTTFCGRVFHALEWTTALGLAALGGVLSDARGGEASDGNGRARPNILWITCEDMSPDLGALGNTYSRTPYLDALAAESVMYVNAFATNPVCSPARSCLITGRYATSLGTQNLRSRFPLPKWIHGFPSHLRRAGYYTTNNVKTDYNTRDEERLIRESWDESSSKAHWRGRKAGQPFFSVFNDMTTHQSRSMVWPYDEFETEVQSRLTADERHDPAAAPIPPYYPDTPTVRRTVARYYDCITVMDKNVGRILGELEEDGLADDTIVFFFSDHGAGLPRHKRLLLDSGLHVPLFVRFGKRYRHLAPAPPGGPLERLVSFIDLPPTVLRLAGVATPEGFQGRPFLGQPTAAPPRYVFGARDRVDEAYDLARSVRSTDYLYIRNYMPRLSYNQPSFYSDQGEIRGEITKLARMGKLNRAQLHYAGPTRAVEELYDVRRDPNQIRNLATSEAHRGELERMRSLSKRWILETRDVGFIPESELARRTAGTTPREESDDVARLPLARILEAAELVGRGRSALTRQLELVHDTDAVVRFWAVVGLDACLSDDSEALRPLQSALADPSAAVRIEAANAVLSRGREPKAAAVLEKALAGDDPHAALRAARALQLAGERARPALPAMRRALERAREGAGDSNMFLRFALEPAVQLLDTHEGT